MFDFWILAIIIISFLSSQVQTISFSASGYRDEGTPTSSSPFPSQIAQHPISDTGIQDFELLSGARMDFDRASDLLVSFTIFTEENKQTIAGLSFSAMKELKRMAEEKQPLWLECNGGEVLNYVEYTKKFWQIDKTVEKRKKQMGEISALLEESLLPLHTEASRHIQFLSVDPVHIVELLMDLVLLLPDLFIIHDLSLC